MLQHSGQDHSASPRPGSAIALLDEAANELLEACAARFAPPDYRVECDDRHTVWVSRADGSRSFGVSPWLLRRHSLDEVLERVATKLGATVAVR